MKTVYRFMIMASCEYFFFLKGDSWYVNGWLWQWIFE